LFYFILLVLFICFLLLLSVFDDHFFIHGCTLCAGFNERLINEWMNEWINVLEISYPFSWAPYLFTLMQKKVKKNEFILQLHLVSEGKTKMVSWRTASRLLSSKAVDVILQYVKKWSLWKEHCQQSLWTWIGNKFKFLSQLVNVYWTFWVCTGLVQYLHKKSSPKICPVKCSISYIRSVKWRDYCNWTHGQSLY
jgi:hypothetical protein